jgi:dihydroorotate dehydrogenase (fumarate)
MIDLSTTYLGLKLAHPLICSSSPLSADVGAIRRLEDGGAAAVVLHSLFEEQIEAESLDLDRYLEAGAESYAEASSYFPELTAPDPGPDDYLNLVRKAKESVSIPIIASLNGTTPGGWVRYSRYLESAGADAIELNVYTVPTDPQSSSQQIEDDLCSLVQEVASSITIPLAVKLGSFYTGPAHLAHRLHNVGATALVLFNRFYQPDFDIDNLSVVPHIKLSHSEELLLRLHWIAILYGRIGLDLAVTGGVHTARDLLKCLMAGATTVMMTSAAIKHGPTHFSTLIAGVRQWMEEHEYDSASMIRGVLSLRNIADPSLFERLNYLKLIRSHGGTRFSTIATP